MLEPLFGSSEMTVLLLVLSAQVVRPQEPSCPARVTELFNNQAQLVERLFEALRQIESEGDQCKINDDRIGPYQLSERYYDEAVAHDERLKVGGTNMLLAI